MHTPSTKNKSNGTELSGAPRFPSAGRHAPDSSEGQPRREDAGIRPRRTGKPFSREEGQSGHGSSRGDRSYPREGRRDFSGRGERRFSHDDRPSFHRDRSYDNSENGSDRGSFRDERPSFSRDRSYDNSENGSDRGFSRDEKPSFSHDRRPGRPYSREDRENFSGRGERRFPHNDRPSFHRDRSYDNSENGSERSTFRDERPSFSRDRRPGRPYSREDRKDFSGRGEHRFPHNDRPSFHRDRSYDNSENGSERSTFRDERPSFSRDRRPGRPYSREDREDFSGRGEHRFPHNDRPSFHRDRSYDNSENRSERGTFRDERPSFSRDRRPGRPYSREDRKDFPGRGEHRFSHNDRPSFQRDRSYDNSENGSERGSFRDERPFSDSERHPGRPYMREDRADSAWREERRFPRNDSTASDSGSRPGRPYMREDRADSTPLGERSFSRGGRPSFSRDTEPRSDSSRGGYRGDSRPAPSSDDDGRSGYGQRKPFAKRWTVDEKDEQDFLRGSQFDGRDGYDVIILGAGASGLSCALRCTELGLSVCVIDRERTPARKLAICGGGRANFTNSSLTPDCYLCGTPGFVDPVLDAFSTMGMTRFMDSLGLPWEKREGGRYFLATSARDLVSALIRGCKKGRFALRTGLNVPADGVRVSDGSVTLTAKDGTSVKGRHLVLALGSPACPAVGATGFGYALAQALGHHVITPEAALTPFILPEDSALFGLQGVSLPVELTVGGETKRTFRDDLLFTHEGLSGPAALKASLFWHRDEPVTIDFFAGQDPGPIFSDEQCGRGTPRSILSKRMPQSLVDSLVPAELLDRRCAEIAKAEREGLLQNLRKYTLVPAGTAGLRFAEVCRGGVDTSEVVPMTFFSRVVPGLSIIGELLDVTGILGGYNLHWAIASGRLAAIALRTRLG